VDEISALWGFASPRGVPVDEREGAVTEDGGQPSSRTPGHPSSSTCLDCKAGTSVKSAGSSSDRAWAEVGRLERWV